MRTIIALTSLVIAAGVLAAPSQKHHTHSRDYNYNPTLRELPALQHEEAHDEYGQYAIRYITAENTVVSERGRLVYTENGTQYLYIEGQYRYIGDDGKVYFTSYHAGPDGFHVDGDHLPKPVPVPAVA